MNTKEKEILYDKKYIATFEISGDVCQTFTDILWRCGYETVVTTYAREISHLSGKRTVTVYSVTKKEDDEQND